MLAAGGEALMARAHSQAVSFAAALTGFAALFAAGLYQSIALEGRLPRQRGYGEWVNELADRKDWPAVVRALELSAALDIDQSAVEVEVIPNLISLARRLGDRDVELFARRKLAERRPSDASAHNGLAWALLAAPEAGELERREAAHHAESALSLDPGSARAHWILGRVALLEGSREEAFEHWEEARRLDGALAKELLEELRQSDPALVEAFLTRSAAAGRR